MCESSFKRGSKLWWLCSSNIHQYILSVIILVFCISSLSVTATPGRSAEQRMFSAVTHHLCLLIPSWGQRVPVSSAAQCNTPALHMEYPHHEEYHKNDTHSTSNHQPPSSQPSAGGGHHAITPIHKHEKQMNSAAHSDRLAYANRSITK